MTLLTELFCIGVPGGIGGELRQVWDMNLEDKSRIESFVAAWPRPD